MLTKTEKANIKNALTRFRLEKMKKECWKDKFPDIIERYCKQPDSSAMEIEEQESMMFQKILLDAKTENPFGIPQQ